MYGHTFKSHFFIVFLGSLHPEESFILRHILKNNCLLTDFYQFTMAQAYFDRGRHTTDAVFNLFFRKNPFKGNWALISGIDDVLDFVTHFRFDADSLDFLSTMTSPKGAPLFSKDFLTFLAKTTPKIDIYGVDNGEIIFPFEPILRVEGPLFLAQLLETPILNIINFQTLIATKAARIVEAAQGKAVVDFGLRRAQGFDGALSATKAAFIGGVQATSNVWAGKNMGIPLSGTQAHSFIMSYERQIHAFSDFADSFKDSCVLVVDTHDPLKGIDDAVRVFKKLIEQGHHPQGLRLDSGDRLHLAKMAKTALNRAGIFGCKIIVSGDLDEHEIYRLEKAKAPIDIYGVGTKLITAYDEPALGGVYKLAAIKEKESFRYTFKESAEGNKISWPGAQTIIRNLKNGFFAFDCIIEKNLGKTGAHKALTPYDHEILLHQNLMAQGLPIKQPSELLDARRKAAQNMRSLPPVLRSIYQADPYPVYFDDALVKIKQMLLGKTIFEDHCESPAPN